MGHPIPSKMHRFSGVYPTPSFGPARGSGFPGIAPACKQLRGFAERLDLRNWVVLKREDDPRLGCPAVATNFTGDSGCVQ